jgi:putative tricarboxylic transport membrane protein
MNANWEKRIKDYAGGALMMLLGIGAMVQGQTYTIGTLNRMGPGFFPVALGAILALIGVALLIDARISEPKRDAKPLPPEWRGWICIIAGIVAFSVIGKYGGFVPASFAIVFISALGERNNTWQGAAVLALTMVVFCVVVFWWALKLQFPLFAWG